MRRLLGLKPTTPHSAAGMRTEPPVSLPIAISHMPSATATAAPAEEPPGTRVRSCGLPGVPKCGLAPTAEKANSVMLVLATITAPPARSRRTMAASAVGRRRLLGEDFRAGAGRLAGDIEQILDADDGAVERPERHAVCGTRIGGVRRRPRGVGIDRQTGPRPLALSGRRCGRARVQVGRGRKAVSCMCPVRPLDHRNLHRLTPGGKRRQNRVVADIAEPT